MAMEAQDTDSIELSHEIKLEDKVSWIAVCNNTSGFCLDPSGRVVLKDSLIDNSKRAVCRPLPKPCLVATVENMEKSYLRMLSMDGAVKFDCNINLGKNIRGLQCYDQGYGQQALFIAEDCVLTKVDLSGRDKSQIWASGKATETDKKTETLDIDRIRGIGGDEGILLFVSGSNKIAVLGKADFKPLRIIAPNTVPTNAILGSLAAYDRSVLVTDREHGQVHKVDRGNLELTSYPTGGISRFEGPCGVAVDSTGRLFVSESTGHSVRAVAAGDGSLLWTLGVPGESGSGDDRLNEPCGLAVVKGDQCEQLVVADRGNKRLLILNLPKRHSK